MRAIKYFLFVAVAACAIGANAQTSDTFIHTQEVEKALQGLLCDPIITDNCIKTRYEAGGVAGSGDYAPMWHFSNRQGMGSHKNGWAYARVGTSGEHRFSRSGIRLDWGVDIIGGHNLTSNIFVQQAYFDFSWKRLHVSLGQKERWGELMNHRLTTGALTESGNARPIPQVRVELPEYWDIPGTKGWVGIRGHIAYGIFTDGNWQEDFAADGNLYVKNTLYHSKAGSMRIGNERKFPLTAEFGLHMVTQFGGKAYNLFGKPGKNQKNPTRLKDFWTAFIPSSGDELYSAMDQANIVGNMLGNWMARASWNAKEWEAHLYYEHTFDDHSQMFMEYGLWSEQLIGIELELKRFNWIKGIALEYFNLKNHCGPIYHDSTNEIPDQISCGDSNYNHGWYGGWFNYGMIIGSPLCTSPVYNKDNILTCYNNRVEAFHLGIEGSPFEWLDYRLLLTKSNNWGTYGFPFTEIKENTSGLVELTFRPAFMEKWSVTASFAFDKGKLYGSNYGGMITITRRNIFHF